MVSSEIVERLMELVLEETLIRIGHQSTLIIRGSNTTTCMEQKQLTDLIQTS